MRKSIKRFVRITILAILLASVVAINYLPSPVRGAQGQSKDASSGKETLQKLCSSCHSLDRVISSRQSREQWNDTIDKMIDLGAKGTDEEFSSILDYLVREYGRVNVNTATADEIAETVGLSATEAEAIVKYRKEKGKFESFEDLSKTPGVGVEKLNKNREAITF